MEDLRRRQAITSILLSDVLDSHGHEKVFSGFRRQEQYMEEFTETFLCRSKNLASGGHVEGTSIKGSDSDVMNIIQGVSVIETPDQVSGEYIELMMVPEGCSPGYVKLEIKKLDLSVEELQTDSYGLKFVSNLESFILKRGNKLYFSSECFKQIVKVSGFTNPDRFPDEGITISGPAVKNKTLLGEIDYVVALECQFWPKVAFDWMNRPRKHHWPSAKLLQNLKKEVRCYVVPTGDETSPDNNIQWRLSFVAIERELMWHMNDTQLKCFIILKILLKSIEQELPGNGLKTYHIKNTMFWACEESPAYMWKENMIMPRVNDCIEKLIQYVKRRKLPQYILPENNLFKNRLVTNDDIQVTVACLEKVSKDVLKTVRVFLPHGSFPVKFKKQNPFFYEKCLKDASYTEFCGFIRYISRGVSVSRIKEYAEIFPRRFPDFKEYSPSIDLAIARAMYIDKVNSCDPGAKSRVEIDMHLKRASSVDPLTSCLYSALFDFHERKYRDAKKRLENVLNVRSTGLQFIEFSAIDNYFVPNVMVLEQILKGGRWFLKINPHVLAYLLLFLSQHLLRQKTESHRTVTIMSSVVHKNSKDYQDYFAHLNFLGYCYTLIGQYDMAFRTFCDSLRVFPSVVNAAAYHLAFIVNQSNLVCH